MLFKQYFSGNPVRASYLIGDELTRHAVVIDPAREVDRYLTDVRRAGYSIRYVVVTSLDDHATFVGSAELRARTGARIVTSAGVEGLPESLDSFDSARLKLGELQLEFRAGTPNAEHGTTVAVYDQASNNDVPSVVLDGDTLSLGAHPTERDLPRAATPPRPALVRAFPQITAGALADRWTENSAPWVVDVRSEREWSVGHLLGSRNIPLSQLTRCLDEIPRDRPVIVYCANGQRSIIAASRLAAAGYTNVAELTGGYQAWVMALLPVESELTLVMDESAPVEHGQFCPA